MQLTAPTPSEKSKFSPCPAGSYAAVCTQVIDLGTSQTNFLDEHTGQPKFAHSVRFTFEVNEMMQDGRPFVVSQELTLSMHEKAKMRQFLSNWRGKDFGPGESVNLKDLIGKGCSLSIVEYTKKNGEVGTKIGSISRLMKGMEVPKPANPTIYFDLEAFDEDTYAQLPQWLQDKIAGSQEFKNINAEASF